MLSGCFSELLKLFNTKTVFWFVMAVFSSCILSIQSFSKWLGVLEIKWVFGLTFILSWGIVIQHIYERIQKIIEHKNTIKNIKYLPYESLCELRLILKENKKTLKIKDSNGLEQHRIIAHFKLPIEGKYAIFPDYLWNELKKQQEDGRFLNYFEKVNK